MAWLQIAMKGIGSFAEGAAQRGDAQGEAAAETQNARNLDEMARQVGSVGARNEEAARREYRAFAGAQFASIAESGLGAEGSALDIVRDSETAANLDALNIRYDASERAREIRYGAEQARARSSLARQMAKRAKIKMFAEATGIIGSSDKFAGISGKGGGRGGSGLMALNYTGSTSRGKA